MSVPDFQSILLPVLRIAGDGKEHSMADFRERIAADLKLSPEELSEKLPSGTQTVFANRVAWSAVYLHRAGALERSKRGVFRITDRGRELLKRGLSRITVQILSEFPEFVAFHKGTSSGKEETNQRRSPKFKTPEEQLGEAYKILRNTL